MEATIGPLARQLEEANRLLASTRDAAERTEKAVDRIGGGFDLAPVVTELKVLNEQLRTTRREADETHRALDRVGRGGGGGLGGLAAILPGGQRATGGALGLGIAALATAAAPLLPAVGVIAAIPALVAPAIGALGVLALSGFGNVTKAIGGNKKAYDELLPAQKQFVDQMRALYPILNGMKQIVGQNLFGPIADALKSVTGNAAAMSQLGGILQGMAHWLGVFIGDWIRFLGSTSFLASLNSALATSTPLWTQLSHALQDVISGLLNMVRTFQPLAQYLTDLATKAGKWFEAWSKSKDAADANKVIIQSLQLVGQTVSALFDVIKSLFDVLAPIGRVLLDAINPALHDFAGVLRDNAGFIDSVLIGALRAVGGVLSTLFQVIHDNGNVLKGLFQGAEQSVRDVAAAVKTLLGGLTPLLQQLNAIAKAIGGWRVVIDGIVIFWIARMTGLLGFITGFWATFTAEGAAATTAIELDAIGVATAARGIGVAFLSALGPIALVSAAVYGLYKVTQDFWGGSPSGTKDIGASSLGKGLTFDPRTGLITFQDTIVSTKQAADMLGLSVQQLTAKIRDLNAAARAAHDPVSSGRVHTDAASGGALNSNPNLPGGGGYAFPMPGGTYSSQRVDQGKDFGGSGPVYAIGDGIVVRSEGAGSGWPGGGWISITLTSGSRAGWTYFVAEYFRPVVSSGARVRAGQLIGYRTGGGIEMGWVSSPTQGNARAGNALTSQLGQNARQKGISSDPGAVPSQQGQDFAQFLNSLHSGQAPTPTFGGVPIPSIGGAPPFTGGPAARKPTLIDQVLPPGMAAQLSAAQTRLTQAQDAARSGGVANIRKEIEAEQAYIAELKKVQEHLDSEHATGDKLKTLERERLAIAKDLAKAHKDLAKDLVDQQHAQITARDMTLLRGSGVGAAAPATGSISLRREYQAIQRDIQTYSLQINSQVQRQLAVFNQILQQKYIDPHVRDIIRERMDAIKQTITDRIAAMKQALSDAGSAFDSFASRVLAAFDAINSKYQSPASKQLAEMQKEDRDRQLQANLAAAKASGDAQQIADAERAIQEAALEDQAKQQQDAHDAETKAQKDALEKQLANLRSMLQKHKITWKEYKQDVDALLKSYGITPDALQAATDWQTAQGLFVESMSELRNAMKELGAPQGAIYHLISSLDHLASQINAGRLVGDPPPSGGTPHAASGGIFDSVPGGLIRVVEAGHPEAIIPLDPARRPRAHELMDQVANIVGFADGGLVQGKLWGKPKFSGEGPQFYSEAYSTYRPFAKAPPWKTALTAQQEATFRRWAAYVNGVAGENLIKPNTWPNDYDDRGYWLHNGAGINRPSYRKGQHGPDTWKTPYDTAFSRESRYATADNPFTWTHGNTLYDMRNRIMGSGANFADGGIVGFQDPILGPSLGSNTNAEGGGGDGGGKRNPHTGTLDTPAMRAAAMWINDYGSDKYGALVAASLTGSLGPRAQAQAALRRTTVPGFGELRQGSWRAPMPDARLIALLTSEYPDIVFEGGTPGQQISAEQAVSRIPGGWGAVAGLIQASAGLSGPQSLIEQATSHAIHRTGDYLTQARIPRSHYGHNDPGYYGRMGLPPGGEQYPGQYGGSSQYPGQPLPPYYPAARGALVRARPGGTLILAGEAGEDEMVMPMSRAGGRMVLEIHNHHYLDGQQITDVVTTRQISNGRYGRPGFSPPTI